MLPSLSTSGDTTTGLNTGKVLVTGATGFIGFHLVQLLRERGQIATGLARKPFYPMERIRADRIRSLGTTLISGDVSDPAGLAEAVAGKSVVYHLAGCTRALHRRRFYEVNEQGTRNVIEACARQPKPPVVVMISSLAAAGPSPDGSPRVETDPCCPVSHYGRSKRAAELAAEQFADRVPITVIRPPIVFGEGDLFALPLFKTITRFRVHMVPTLGRHYYSMVYVGDLVRALVSAAERGTRLAPPGRNAADGRTRGYYFVAHHEQPTYADIGRMVRPFLHRPRALIVPVPSPFLWLGATNAEITARILRRPFVLNYDKIREAIAGSWACSSRKAKEELEFTVGEPLREQLGRTAEAYRRDGLL